MFKQPSVNQITSAYTGHMPQLSQRVQQDKQANNGIAKDLRMVLAEADMAENIKHQQNQAALQNPQNPPTVAQTIHNQILQMTQGQPRMQPQAAPVQPPPAQGIAQLQAGAPASAPAQGIDQIPTNVGQAYAYGGIIGYDGENGSYVDERDTLRRMEAQAYEENNPPPKAPPSSADIIMQAMMADPAARRKEAEERRNAIKRDTSSHDRLIAEYEAEKERLNPPKEGYAAFMNYISKIASAPKGLGSLSAGAYGAQQVNAEQEAQAAKRHELTKQMLDVSQKKADLGYQQKMDVFGAGEGAEAAAVKARYEAAINRETNTLEKQKLAQQMELALKNLAADKERTAAMNKPPAFQQIYTELQRLQPDADKSKLFQQAVSMAGLSAKQDSAEAQMLDKLNDAIKQYDAAEAKLNFVKMTDPKQYAIDKGALDKKRDETEKLRSQLYSRIGGGGLPDLNKANPAASTAAPGQTDYSKLWK
jgi:hypothetical protein